MKKGDDLFDEGDPFDDPRWKEAETARRKRRQQKINMESSSAFRWLG